MPGSISKLYNYMEMNSQVGGCCGEIEVDIPNDISILNGSYYILAS
jgi:hypothetical protein